MENTCFYCGKQIRGISWSLKNGCLCDECYEKAKKCSGKITHRNINLYSVEEIKNILNPLNGSTDAEKPDSTEIKNTIYDTSGQSPVQTASAVPSGTKSFSAPAREENKEENKNSPFGIIKTIGWTIVAILIIICIINPSFKDEIAGKLFNRVLELDGTAYVEMVKDIDFLDGLTYRELLDQNDYFESKEWKYFKDNGNKYVQFNGVGNGDVLQIKFALECVNEEEGRYLITPQDISVNGVSIPDILSLLSLFNGD